jgi:hypothetical protein
MLIASHHERIQGDEARPVRGLIVTVGGRCQARGRDSPGRLGHLLDADDEREVNQARAHRVNPGPESGPA